MKKTLLLLCLFVLMADSANAVPLINRFHLGVSAGMGLGYLSDATTAGGTESYGNISYMAHAGLRITKRTHIRLSMGVDDYINFDDNSDTRNVAKDDGFGFSGELDAMFYPFPSMPLIKPYGFAGAGYPRALHAGVGADVAFSPLFRVFAEVMYGTAIVDHRGQGRLGVKFVF